MIGAVGRDAFADEALAGLRDGRRRARARETRRADRRRADPRSTRPGRRRSSSAPGRERGARRGRAAAARRGPLPARDPGRGRHRRPGSSATGCSASTPRRRGPIAVDPDLTVVNRFELEALVARRTASSRSRSAPRARSCSRTARRSPAPPRRRSTASTAPRRATRSPRACSSRCSRAATTRRRSAAPAPPARSPPRASAPSRRFRRRPRSTRSCARHRRHEIYLAERDGDADHPRLRPRARRRDRAPARAREPGGRAARRHDRHGNQTLEKTTANALRVLELAGRSDIPVAAGADRPLERELAVAAHVHGESGLDGPALPPAEPSAARRATRSTSWRGAIAAQPGAGHARADRAAHERRAATSSARAAPSRAHRPDGRRDRRGQHDAGGRVQHLGRPRGGAGRASTRGST